MSEAAVYRVGEPMTHDQQDVWTARMHKLLARVKEQTAVAAFSDTYPHIVPPSEGLKARAEAQDALCEAIGWASR